MKLRNTPTVSLKGNYLEYITSYKYLGVCIHECIDDHDINRHLKSVIYSLDVLTRVLSILHVL